MPEPFGNRVSSLVMTRHVRRTRSEPAGVRSFGAMIAIRASLELAPERRATFDRAFEDAIVRWNGGRDVGAVEIAYEYLLVVARRR